MMPSPDTQRALLSFLARHDEASQALLADALGVTDRTVRRHLSVLEHEGLVTATRRQRVKRYRLADGAHETLVQPLALTEDEMQALAVAVLAARSLLAPTPFAGPLGTAAEKLERDWLAHAVAFEADDESARWHFDDATGGAPPPFDPDVFAALLRAVREQQPIEADYYTASRQARSTRRLHPLGLFVHSGSWMLAAFCERAGAVRDFALPGFEAVRVVEGERFDPPAGFSLTEHGRDRFGALAGEPELVRLHVTAEAVPAFRRKFYNPTQQIEAEHADGSAVVSFEAGGMDSIASWVLSWGPKVRALEPEALVETVREAHRQALDGYDA
jgi:predicted DNA-binding transcriptional regulator YafY